MSAEAWIKCSDSLPGSDEVLVAVRWPNTGNTMVTAAYYCEHGPWWLWDSDRIPCENVVAWKPLPTFPEGF